MGNIICFQVAFNNTNCGCWDWILKHANYVCQLRENLTVLGAALKKLTDLRDDVQTVGKKPLAQVTGWTSRVENLEAKVNQLIRDGTEELNQVCLSGCCPRHFCNRYRLGKRAAEFLEDVGQLIEEKTQNAAAERLAPGESERPCEVTVGLDSKLNQAWSCIHQDGTGTVGLYGLGGVGKTALLTQINNAFIKRAHDFHHVVWVTVSRNVDLEKIQDDIWKKIGICDDKWKNKRRDEKAASIWNTLSKNKFVLLLDDVWERLNLVDVGVPLENKKNKIVLTTRSEGVCGEMEADLKIKVECLTWTESWDLIQRKVGEDTLKLHPDISKQANLVARECCGLPLVLTTAGRAMACKRTPQEWKYAVKVLQSSASKFPGMIDKVLPLLKYSYDSLPTEAAQSCFLYCSLYPEDFPIPKEGLIGSWIFEGFIDAYDDDVEATKDHGYNMIGTLIYASLLEETDDCFFVKMHDVIRDMALWITLECGKAHERFLVKAGCGLTEAPEVDEWMELKRISLMNNRIDKLIGSPNCPNLVTLFLRGNPLKMITDDFFRFMPNLRVLNLSNTSITELPWSISYLVSLQYLNLSDSMIKKLPIELKNLNELKYLFLLHMPPFFSIPKQLISSFSKIRVIQISTLGNSDGAILKDDLLSNGNEALVKELESLNYLHDVCVPITTATSLETLLRSNRLRSCIYYLVLRNFNTSSSLNIGSLNKAKHLCNLNISRCDFKQLEIDLTQKGKEVVQSNYLNSKVCFHSLEHVVIYKCRKLKDLTWLVFAPNLKALIISKCDQMQEVVSRNVCSEYVDDGESLCPFATLRELQLLNLPLLESIFWKGLPLTCLMTMTIYKCPLLKKLPLNINSMQGNRVAIYSNSDWWNGVDWEDEATSNAFLPCIKHVEEK